jgi:hypothetical protein
LLEKVLTSALAADDDVGQSLDLGSAKLSQNVARLRVAATDYASTPAQRSKAPEQQLQ